jgi:hypothetical protein
MYCLFQAESEVKADVQNEILKIDDEKNVADKTINDFQGIYFIDYIRSIFF